MKSEKGEVSVNCVIKAIIAIICFIGIVLLVYDSHRDDTNQNTSANTYIENSTNTNTNQN